MYRAVLVHTKKQLYRKGGDSSSLGNNSSLRINANKPPLSTRCMGCVAYEIRIQGLGLRVQGLGFRVGFRTRFRV